MEKEKHTESASRQPDNGAAEKGKKTKTYKHVKLEHKRPQLTKGGEAGDGAQKKRKPTQKKRSSSAGKDPKAKLKIIPLGGLDAIGKNMTVLEGAVALKSALAEGQLAALEALAEEIAAQIQ